MKDKAGLSQPVFLQCVIKSRNTSVKYFLKLNQMKKKGERLWFLVKPWSNSSMNFCLFQISCILLARFWSEKWHQIAVGKKKKKKGGIKFKSLNLNVRVLYFCAFPQITIWSISVSQPVYLPTYLLLLPFFPLSTSTGISFLHFLHLDHLNWVPSFSQENCWKRR